MKKEQNSNNNKTTILFVIIALLLALNGVWLYLHFGQKEEIAQKEATIIENEGALNKAKASLDSLNNELTIKIEEVKKLKGDTTLLGAMRQELMDDLKTARGARAGDLSKIALLQQKVNLYMAQLKERDAEIALLKKEKESFYNESIKLKRVVVQRDDSIIKLKNSQNELDAKIAIAQILKAENLKVTIIDSKGKEREEESYKAKRVDKVKVTFNIGDNKVAKIETKEVSLRMIEPDGNVISDPAMGGGVFASASAENISFTSKQSYLFDNKLPSLTFLWQRGTNLKTGNYKVEIWSEGYKIGETQFNIR